jgi:dihydroflavonol-4-reductase
MVARELVRAGREVRLLVRPAADRRNLHDLPVEFALGDVRDLDSVMRATAGCTQVYHVAALYKLWVRHRQEIYDCNVTGTEQVLKAARVHEVERVIYTSSVATLGLPQGGAPGTEETPVSLADMIGHYKRSKFLAEQVALRYAAEGLPVVIVNPSTPVGVGDLKPTPTGKLIVDFVNGRMPGYVDTGLNLVDVEDVARGHVLAAEKGRVGEKYILGHENLTLQQILALLAELTGRSAPRLKVPYVLALGVAYVDAALARLIPGREPFAPPVGVKLSKKKMFFDPGKAVRELGWTQIPVREALQKAVRWFVENGYVKEMRD